MQVVLFKKTKDYVDNKTGEKKKATNFYLRCNESLIPIQVTFFKDEEGKDRSYGSRKAVLEAFATVLPERDLQGAEKQEEKPKPQIEEVGDEAIPF